MKSRAFAYLRHAAVIACVGGGLGLALPAMGAESGAPRGVPGKIDLKASSALKRGPAVVPAYGMRFPVGAPAYVRPFRGFLLPRVWIAPVYYIPNWQGFGLARPAQGFGWSRYYDDAVLTDRNGRVYDSVQGVNWAAAQAAPLVPGGQATVKQTYSPDYDPYNYDSDLLLGNDVAVHGTHWVHSPEADAPGVDYDADDYANAPPPPPASGYDGDYDPAFLEACRRDSGLGGAAIGAAAGGLAGNRIAGRGNRTGGTLIGAGVGAVAGMVIDKAEDRERCKRLLARQNSGPGQGGYGATYAPPPVAPPPAYAGDYDPAFLEACRRDSGLGGAVIGAAVGGLAGNRIAGRGNRTGGTLIGAGVGAVAGMVIDKAEDRERCKRLLAQHGGGYPPAAGHHNGYPPPPPGYYYYYPPPIVTTVTITPGCNCTEEVVTTHVTRARHRPKQVHRTKNVKVYRK